MPTASSRLKVFEGLARALADHRVETLFGLVGDANLYMVDSYIRDQGGRYIAAANEAGAVLMALGYAQVTGKIGVATVTHGPALTNTLTSLIEGVKGSIPSVLLCGDTAITQRDNLQNVPQRELIVATGAGFEQLRAPETLGEDVATAFRRAAAERRPVALNMPADYQWLEAEYGSRPIRTPSNRTLVPESGDLDDAIGMISASKRPLLLAGRGAVGAKDALLRLAARLDAPVATTLQAKGLFKGEDFDLGVCGTLATDVAVDTITSSDCIIAFGAGLNHYTTSNGAFLRGKRVIQVDSSLPNIGRYATPDVGLVGDCELTAEAMHRWLDEAEIPPSQFRDDALRARLRAWKPPGNPNAHLSREGTVDISEALRRLNAGLPADRIFVTDGGRFLTEAWKTIDVEHPNCFVSTVNFGAIGMGMGQAIGAAAAGQGKPVVLVIGDGGFALGGLTEFNTAVRHKLDLIVVLCNDGGYGAEHIQFRSKGLDPSLSLLDWPDFAPVAESLGGLGLTVRTEADLDAAMAATARRDRPVLIDLKLDADAIPPPSW